MKQGFFAALSAIFFLSTTACAQPAGDKSKRPSPPATFTCKSESGATITINYSQPSLKGRTIGKDVEPKDGNVWRTGANEATVFETNKNVLIEGQPLPAGKYGLFTLTNGEECFIIFNKTWDQWGAYDYKEADDALRVKVPIGKAKQLVEKLMFLQNAKGQVGFVWGNVAVYFDVK